MCHYDYVRVQFNESDLICNCIGVLHMKKIYNNFNLKLQTNLNFSQFINRYESFSKFMFDNKNITINIMTYERNRCLYVII